MLAQCLLPPNSCVPRKGIVFPLLWHHRSGWGGEPQSVYVCLHVKQEENGQLEQTKTRGSFLFSRKQSFGVYEGKRGHVGKEQWRKDRPNPALHCGLTDQDLSLEHGFQTSSNISQNTRESFFEWCSFCNIKLKEQNRTAITQNLSDCTGTVWEITGFLAAIPRGKTGLQRLHLFVHQCRGWVLLWKFTHHPYAIQGF